MSKIKPSILGSDIDVIRYWTLVSKVLFGLKGLILSFDINELNFNIELLFTGKVPDICQELHVVLLLS